MKDYTIQDLREAWLKTAYSQWERDIVDEDASDEIIEIFETVGWSFWLKSKEGYRNTETFAWCGHFQSYCGLNLGHKIEEDMSVPIMLDHDIARIVLASTYRLVNKGKWKQAGYEKPAVMFEPDDNGGWVDKVNGESRAAEDVFIPGTIATIAAKDYGDYRDRVGGHFVCIEELDGNKVSTIEGNAIGELYSGEKGEGVVRRRGDNARDLEDFRRVVHFNKDHFDYISSV